ncbi:MAG TPA: response regulator, partial [Methylomirabilota bacterium]|nr:response regulator [Methylomirabilota bacterium]
GYDSVVEAEDAQAALAKLASEQVDFVITDWAMPRMSGLHLVQKIRSDAAGATLPILMVTAIAREEEIQLAAQAGVNGYIVKPFEYTSLRRIIDQILDEQKGGQAASRPAPAGHAAGAAPHA